MKPCRQLRTIFRIDSQSLTVMNRRTAHSNLFRYSSKHLTIVWRQTWKKVNVSFKFLHIDLLLRLSTWRFTLPIDIYPKSKPSAFSEQCILIICRLWKHVEQCSEILSCPAVHVLSAQQVGAGKITWVFFFFFWCSRTRRAHKDAGTHARIHTCTQ